jgi:hypothetical protein
MERQRHLTLRQEFVTWFQQTGVKPVAHLGADCLVDPKLAHRVEAGG